MADSGDVFLADLGSGGRRRVLVLSNRRFHRVSHRAIVAPALSGVVGEPEPPWRILVGPDLFALDSLRSLRLDRLLEVVGRADQRAVSDCRRALAAIT